MMPLDNVLTVILLCHYTCSVEPEISSHPLERTMTSRYDLIYYYYTVLNGKTQTEVRLINVSLCHQYGVVHKQKYNMHKSHFGEAYYIMQTKGPGVLAWC